MSGVEDIQKDPPDPHIEEREEEQSDHGKEEEVTQPDVPVPIEDSSESQSLTGSWTLLDKEEDDNRKVC